MSELASDGLTLLVLLVAAWLGLLVTVTQPNYPLLYHTVHQQGCMAGYTLLHFVHSNYSQHHPQWTLQVQQSSMDSPPVHWVEVEEEEGFVAHTRAHDQLFCRLNH